MPRSGRFCEASLCLKQAELWLCKVPAVGPGTSVSHHHRTAATRNLHDLAGRERHRRLRLDPEEQTVPSAQMSGSRTNEDARAAALRRSMTALRRQPPTLDCARFGLPTARGSIRLGSTRVEVGSHLDRRCCLVSRTPIPPPFSGRNSIPPSLSADRSASRVSARPPTSPSAASNLLIVGTEMPDRAARSSCDQPSSALAALIWRIATFGIDIPLPVRYFSYQQFPNSLDRPLYRIRPSEPIQAPRSYSTIGLNDTFSLAFCKAKDGVHRNETKVAHEGICRAQPNDGPPAPLLPDRCRSFPPL
jgi:hypothetical protein